MLTDQTVLEWSCPALRPSHPPRSSRRHRSVASGAENFAEPLRGQPARGDIQTEKNFVRKSMIRRRVTGPYNGAVLATGHWDRDLLRRRVHAGYYFLKKLAH